MTQFFFEKVHHKQPTQSSSDIAQNTELYVCAIISKKHGSNLIFHIKYMQGLALFLMVL